MGCSWSRPSRSNRTESRLPSSDSLANSRRIKCLTVADDFTHGACRSPLTSAWGASYVTRLLDEAAKFRGYPRRYRTDNVLNAKSFCRVAEGWRAGRKCGSATVWTTLSKRMTWCCSALTGSLAHHSETRFKSAPLVRLDLREAQNSIGHPAEGPSIIYGVIDSRRRLNGPHERIDHR